MDRSIRRHLVLAAVLAFVTLLAAGSISPTSAPSSAHNALAASSDANASFDPPDVAGRPSKAPPILLAGEVSNLRPIFPALPTPRPNGYCVTVNDGVTGVTPHAAFGLILGFRVAPGAGLAANVPVVGRQPGSIVQDTVLQPVNLQHSPLLIPGSSPDQYCLQIIAPTGYTSVVISWSYDKDGVLQPPINVELPVANVTLAFTNGRFSPGVTPEPARVCTEGWGWDPGNIPISGGQFPFFLTGAGAMAAASPAPNLVAADNNPLLSDWVWTGTAQLPVGGGDYYELHSSPLSLASPPENSVRTDHFEHCIALVATAAGSSQVTFEFGSIYQPGVVAEALPAVISDTAPATVSFSSDATRRLRNIGPSGQMLVAEMLKPGFPANPTFGTDLPFKVLIQDNIVRNASHTACLTQTNSGSGVTLANFTATPSLQSPSLFTAGSDIPDLQGAACLRWTSSSAGPQSVFYSGTNANSEDHSVVVWWDNLHFTELTDSQFQSKNIVTNTNISRALTFNLGNGTFTSAPLNIVEWVYGDVAAKAVAPAAEPHTKAVSTSANPGDRLLSGALIRATISSQCGGFGAPNVKSITGHSAWGRFVLDSDPNKNIDDLNLSVTNDASCGASSTITVQVDVFYPDDSGFTTPATAPETLTVTFTFSIPNKTPRFAWAGQQVTITYAVSAPAGTCTGSFVKFVRASGQPGAFLPGPGVTLSGASDALVDFDLPSARCSASVVYESEDPGEVDVEAFIQGLPSGALQNAGSYSKIAFPVYFMLLEDVTITATPTTVVSTPGDVSASVRGYFVGTNPSGRLAEKKPDGRTTPADRWVMPTDYEKLRGSAEFRPNWPGSAPMPPARVTFLMENEGVRNSYAPSVKTGALGWFLPDDATDILFNINPITNQPSVLGTEARPRIMSELSDTSGNASVDTFGDLNLTYEACARSPINGNPLCKPDDVVGHTAYYTVTDYPFAQKKFPPIISNTVTTEWTWFGYKSVTVVNTENPQIKYIVAHLRDRDGFCDAFDFNNVLGVKVRFEIDAGGGTIIDAADRPYTISGNRRFADVTTFDIRNDLNQPMNTDIAKTSVSDDECQAWIRVTNSLLQPTNVIVTFPAPPSPVPGNVRITGLTCTGLEQITVTNQGTKPVSLAGFSFLSPPQAFGPLEYFGLDGHLDPGQSLTFTAGPAAPKLGWLFSGDEVFTGGGDYASLVWDGFEIDRVYCDGRPAIHNTIPASFPLDLEGEIVLDITIPFGTETAVELVSGWNLLTAGSADTVIKDALAGKETSVNGIYLWDEVKAQWGRYIPSAPASVNTISKFEKGKIYWVQVNQPFTLTLLK
ncbi:MAG: hypothetical protein ABI939_00490 [Anaerolineaceae bacterium]